MKKRFLWAAVLCGLVLGLFLGGCENPANGDDGPSAQELADEFKAAQSAVLEKTTETVGLGDEDAVDAALAAYDALSAGVKELLAAEKAKLDGLKAKIAELKTAASPEALAETFRTGQSAVLEKTTETVGLGDEAAVDAALAAYNALSYAAKELLNAEKTTLDGLKAKIDEIKASDAVETFRTAHATALAKTVGTVAESDETVVNAALAAYNALSAAAKALLTDEKTTLDNLKAKIEDLKATTAADAFKDAHGAVLGKTAESIAIDDEALVDAALTAYNALSAAAKALLGTEKTTLDNLKVKIEELTTATAAFRTAHSVVLAKTVDDIAISDETTVDAALAAYNALNVQVQALLVTEKTTLDGLKAKIEELKAATVSTVEAMQSYLAGKEANDVDSPYPVFYTGSETPAEIYAALGAADKFVDLDLSASFVTGFATGTEAGRAKIVSLILPDSLTATGNSSNSSSAIFRNFTNLKTVRADGLVTLGKYNFRALASLTTVILPNATTIVTYGITNCVNLTTIEAPKVETIEQAAFSGNTKLEEIHLPSASTFGLTVFSGCTSLTTIILGNTPPTTFAEYAGSTNLFMGIAQSGGEKTITFKAPDVSVYTSAGSPWSDKIGANKDVGYYWDSMSPIGKDSLTVALEAINP